MAKKSEPAAAATPAPVVGQEVLYRPNDRETYRGRVTVVNADNSVELVYTTAAGQDATVTVPYLNDAIQNTVGPHWVEEPE